MIILICVAAFANFSHNVSIEFCCLVHYATKENPQTTWRVYIPNSRWKELPMKKKEEITMIMMKGCESICNRVRPVAGNSMVQWKLYDRKSKPFPLLNYKIEMENSIVVSHSILLKLNGNFNHISIARVCILIYGFGILFSTEACNYSIESLRI